MKKKGNSYKQKKFIRKLPKKIITRKWGYIPINKRFCIICKLLEKGICRENLTVHHDIPQSEDGTNKLCNLEIICEKHHKQLHHKYFYKNVKNAYYFYRKAKFNKIQKS